MSDDDDDEDETSFWEAAATGAVDDAMEAADYDELSGLIVLPDSSGDPRMASSCESIEELQAALESIYNEQWYANVPFDGGEALYRDDADGYVTEIIERDEIVAFFAQFGDKPEGSRIVAAADLLNPAKTKIVRIDVEEINDELVKFLAAHPEKMYDLQPRKFEVLVAELFKNKGYEVQLTPRTRDGGVDVYAARSDAIGTVLIIIECKRYAAKNKVGVEIVRGLYGVVEAKRATKGMIATTSYFSNDAKRFYQDQQYRLALADFDELTRMLNEWRMKRG